VFVAGADWFLSGSLDRRTLLKGASSAALGLLASAVGPLSAAASPLVDGVSSSPLASSQASAAPRTSGAAPQSAAAPSSTDGPASGETAYVFNVGSKDVTLIDVASRQVRETRPLGSSVRWLSNEQTYWDGARIWTYDFPNDQVQAIAIDPKLVTVTKTIPRLGKGPGHSLVVLPGGKKAAINVAGDNLIAFLDLEHGQVDGTLRTGAFP
jgi:DNA-binding beta-propeller fold protein YncE